MNLDTISSRSLSGLFEERAPLDRFHAELIARKLDSLDKRGLADDFGNSLVCVVPTLQLARELTPHLRGHSVIVEVCAGHGWLRRTFVDAGLLAGRDYYATDKLVDCGGVERMDYLESALKYGPSLVICSWPPPRPEVIFWMEEWDALDVRSVIAIGPWPASTPKAGQLITGIPPGWSGTEIPSASREVVDVFGNISRVYVFHKGLFEVGDNEQAFCLWG